MSIEFNYLKVPIRYKCIYTKLLLELDNLGMNLLNDCKSVCIDHNKIIMLAWNMFQSACINYYQDNIELADKIIDYIISILKLKCDKNIEYYQVILNILNNVSGIVTGNGVYEKGSIITIKAIPNNGYRFDSWDDDVTDAIREIIVDKDIELTAKFTELIYTITVSSTGNGSVSGGGDFKYGQRVTITATPDKNYIFDKWNDGNTNNPRTITVTENKEYIASFINNVENTILFAETNDLSQNDIRDFLNGNIEDYKEILISYINRSKDIIIKGSDENRKEFNVNTTTHVLLVPDNEIKLIEIGYTTNGIYNNLFRSGYIGTNKVFNYEGIDYRVYLYYNGSGSIDEPIILKAKNK